MLVCIGARDDVLLQRLCNDRLPVTFDLSSFTGDSGASETENILSEYQRSASHRHDVYRQQAILIIYNDASNSKQRAP